MIINALYAVRFLQAKILSDIATSGAITAVRE